MRVLSSISFAMLVGWASCSSTPTCEELCERQAACEDTPSDCVANCQESERRADSEGCPERHTSVSECLDDAADICDPGCDTQISELFACTCPGGSCITDAGCAVATANGSDEGFCSVIGICGEDTLSLNCFGPDDTCTCRDAADNETSVPYQAAFCADDATVQGDAAAEACGWPNSGG